MSDLRRRREEERQRYGLDYINNPHARGKCWICHYRPIYYAPKNAREYAIWRRRKIPLICDNGKCYRRSGIRELSCDYCGDWADWRKDDDYQRHLLRTYDVIRCWDCEKFSFEQSDFESDYEYDHSCKLCGRQGRDMVTMTDPIEGYVYEPICKSCQPVLQDRFARKYLSFDEI